MQWKILTTSPCRRSVHGSLRHTCQGFPKPREWSDCHSALKACVSFWVGELRSATRVLFSDRVCTERVKGAGALAAADGAALEVQPRMGPEARTGSPSFESPLIAAHEAAWMVVTQPWRELPCEQLLRTRGAHPYLFPLHQQGSKS